MLIRFATLVPRTRSSHDFSAGTFANFGFKSGTSIIELLESFSLPKLAQRPRRLLANFGIGTLALLMSLVGVPSASAQKMNYLDRIIDLTELIPPAPPPNSDAQRDDLGDVIEMQEKRSEKQVERAIADNVLSIYRFDDVLGPKFKRANLPVTDAFMERAQADARAILIAAKNAIHRPRPAAASQEVFALGGTPRLPTGYPSGGVVFTTLTAITLSKMVPEKRFELSERNHEYAINRVVLGQHFPRDIRAGEIAGTVITYALMEKPAFMRDLEAARVELRNALGYPAEPEAAGSINAK